MNEEVSDLEHLLKEGKISKEKIKLTTSESGEYAILQYKDFFREEHVIAEFDWMDLLKYLGYKIEDKEISDEEMEKLC